MAAPVSIPARWSRPKAANPSPSALRSTSSTSGPGLPVAIATFARGQSRHHAEIAAGSVEASLKPPEVSGALHSWHLGLVHAGLSGRHGNTGQPRPAYTRA